MNYLNVPDSNLKLADGNVVMLERFPGIKWVLHDGWYSYNGRQYMGWYFSSIPSQTILPVNNQDLRMITLVSAKRNDAYPEFPMPPAPGPTPGPGCPHHGPHDHWPPPDPFPPVPPAPPEPKKPAHFTEELKAQLKSAFISVPTLKQRDKLDTDQLPDGKIVRVNSVDGVTKYYAWSSFNDHWEDLNIVFEGDLEEALLNYYQKYEVNELVENLNVRIDEANQTIQNVSDHVDQLESSTAESLDNVRQDIDGIRSDIQAISERIDDMDGQVAEDIAEAIRRIEDLEQAVFDIAKIVPLTDSNTVLVAHEGTLKDSGYNIGDNSIDEPAEYASGKTLATEKAVAKKVEDSALKWDTF